MEFIKSNIVPVKYFKDIKNHRDVFYFEALDETCDDENITSFNENFEFVKKVDENDLDDGEFSSYKITWDKNVDESVVSSNKKIVKLVKYLHRRLESNTIVFGKPLKLLSNEDKNSIKMLPYNKNHFIKGKKLDPKEIFCSNKKPVLTHFDVGHGLSVYDETNKILFDCGGDISATEYSRKIKSVVKKDKFSILITHCHEDHYKYLNKLISDFPTQLQIVITNSFFHKTKKLKEALLKVEHLEMVVETILSFDNWDLYTLNKCKNPNLNSIVCLNDNKIIVGDQSYSRVKKAVSTSINSVTEIQLPHHGGAWGQVGNPLLIPNKNIIKAVWSSNRTRYYPNPTVRKHFKNSCEKANA